MRDAKRLDPPDFFSQIISRASKNITSFTEEFQEQSSTEQLSNDIPIIERKGDMLNVIKSSEQNTDKQLKEINKVRDWLDSLDRDRELYDQISNGTNLTNDSPYSNIDRLINEDRKNRENRTKSKKYFKENLLIKEKNDLRKAAYTQSVISMSKNLLILQKEVQEAMTPENVLKNESSTSIRLENLKEKLEIELKNRKETKKMLKKDLKAATKLFNNNVKYHKKLEEDQTKLDNFLIIFQSKTSNEIIEKAKKNIFIQNQWKDKQKEILSQINEINIELEKYKNNEQTNQELLNINYANNLEFEKKKKNYEDLIESINQDIKLSNFYQTNSLQILEKELINALNYHRGIESKNSQNDIKLATTSFNRLFMKFSKENQNSFNKFDKILRKSNLSFESSIESLNTFKNENKTVFAQSMDQIVSELKQIIQNYCKVFADNFEFGDKKLKFDAKNKIDVLIGRKQRLNSQILNREMDIALNLETFKTMEGVYFDIVKNFWKGDVIFDADTENFVLKASKIVKELSEKLKTNLKSSNHKNKFYGKRSASSMVISPLKINLNKKQSENEDIKEPPKSQTVVQRSSKIEDDGFSFDKPDQNLIEKIEMKPSPPSKSEERSPRFSSQKNSKNQTQNINIFEGQKIDQKINCSSPSVPPDFVFMKNKKRKKNQSEIRNKITDNSPHFCERKSRKPRREKSRAEIEEARRESILKSHQKSKRTIQDIPKIPFIKNVDPKMMNEIDSTYSFKDDSKKKNEVIKKEIKKTNSNEINENRKICNNDEFKCIKNNINVTKKNISELPFSKRKISFSEKDDSKIFPFIQQSRNSFSDVAFFKNFSSKNSINKSATTNVISSVFNFSENIMEIKIDQRENFHRRSKETKSSSDHELDKTKEILRASLDLKNRRNENLFMVKNSTKNKKEINKNIFKISNNKHCYDTEPV